MAFCFMVHKIMKQNMVEMGCDGLYSECKLDIIVTVILLPTL